MKLIIAIVQDEDADNLVNALTTDGFRVTRIASTGSFLRVGNTSLFLGVEDALVPRALAIIDRTSHRRMQTVIPALPEYEVGYVPELYEVEVGGAIVLILDVDRFERL